MSLIRVIKQAASASVTVPASKSKKGHKRVAKRRHNKVMPWQSGRKPAVRKEAAESVEEQIIKDAIYRWDNYNGMGGSPNPLKHSYNAGLSNPASGAYNAVVQAGLQSMPGGSGTMGAAVSKGLAGARRLKDMEAARESASQPTQYEQDSSWKTLFSDPGRFADSVLGRYNNQSTAGKIMGNVGGGAEIAGYGLGGGLGVGIAGSMGQGGGPSTVDKLLAAPATWAANIQDRTHAKTVDYTNFQKLMQRGMHEDASNIYPELWKQHQRSGNVAAPYSLGQMAGTMMQSLP